MFHTGAGEPAREELAQLSRHAAAVFPSDLRDLAANPYLDWHDVLDHLTRLAVDQPVLLVLDEFPELLSTSPALPGVLRSFSDRAGVNGGLRVLLCGSAVRTMLSIQETRAPLYGRFDLTLQVQPFRPHEAAAMLPGLAPAQQAFVYGILGGMPLYLSWWDSHRTVEENILELACQPGARLLTEGRLVLATEAGDGDLPGAVLRAVAKGRTKFNEIEEAVGTNPTRALDRLIELRLLQRILPVTEDERSRRRIYQISDNFLAFFLGPLLKYRGEIELDLGETILPALLGGLNDHLGPMFEEMFREHLRRMARAGELGPNVVAVGPWWTSDGQNEIDAVALAEPERTRVPVLVGEAKWARSVHTARLRAELREKAAKLTDDPDRLIYAICARESVIQSEMGVLPITAADIFAG